MTKQQIEQKIVENAGKMADEIKRGRDVEIKTSSTGIKFFSIDKKVVR